MKKIELILKGVKYAFTIERGKVMMESKHEKLSFEEWLTSQFTDFVGLVEYTDALSRERYKLEIIEALVAFDKSRTFAKFFHKEYERINRKARLLNQRELVRERRERKR